MDGSNALVPATSAPQAQGMSNEQLLELEKQRDQNQYDFAVKNLEATLKNQMDMRESFNRGQKNSFLFLGGIVSLVFIFFMVALFLGKDAFLADLVKIIMGGIGGAGIGYMAGFKRGRIEPPSIQQ